MPEATKKSFTLLELLIVVVIIAVIGTLAIPQYDKVMLAVDKSGAYKDAYAISDSIWRYYVETGSFPENVQDSKIPPCLDIKIQTWRSKYYYNYTKTMIEPVSGAKMEGVVMIQWFNRGNYHFGVFFSKIPPASAPPAPKFYLYPTSPWQGGSSMGNDYHRYDTLSGPIILHPV